MYKDDRRGLNQIDKVACSFVRVRFGRRSQLSGHASARCDRQMEDAAVEANSAMGRLEKQ